MTPTALLIGGCPHSYHRLEGVEPTLRSALKRLGFDVRVSGIYHPDGGNEFTGDYSALTDAGLKDVTCSCSIPRAKIASAPIQTPLYVLSRAVNRWLVFTTPPIHLPTARSSFTSSGHGSAHTRLTRHHNGDRRRRTPGHTRPPNIYRP